MKISTKGRYGLEAIIDLAIHSKQEHISLKRIAERCKISEAYMLQIFLKLRRAGIVNSVRGAQGGYILAKEPSKLTVGDILTVLEGPLAPVECVVDGVKNKCNRYERCATRNLWKSIMDVLNDVSNSITIEHLVECYNKNISK